MGNALDTAMRIYSLLEPLGNFIAPSEYGLKRDQKVEIGVKTVRTLIKKVLSDITYPRSVCEDEAATVSVALPRRKLSLEKIAVRHHRHYHPHHHRPHHHRPSGITASQAPSQTPSCQREGGCVSGDALNCAFFVRSIGDDAGGRFLTLCACVFVRCRILCKLL
eukprot:GHVU01078880.1.p1 GENE.GHVU01078880.1~~GHVU01078880.1.p1  ORF type:complete len:164 (+),score=10.65 GHVU01078880.1:424-915(+)